MTISPRGIDFIKDYEKCRLEAYQDQAGIWTIGWGCIMYENGDRVQKGHKITQARADSLFARELKMKEAGVNRLLKGVALKQQQYDALVSFSYNCGIAALAGSTLLKKIKVDPDDPSIQSEFLRWNKVRKFGILVPSKGLRLRRTAEWLMYSTGKY